MTAAQKIDLISVEDYLAGELVSPIKHEYRGGYVYAMAGAKAVHNRIAGAILGMLFAKLEGKNCEPFASDMLVRVPPPPYDRFYYPDVFVACGLNASDDAYQETPAAIFEVLSKSTRRIVEGEKLDAYLTIPSLAVYALVEQERPFIAVHRRTPSGFVREVCEGLESILPLPEVGTELELARIYARIEFAPEPEDEE
jgi:Uma2 family endonuclease